MTNSKAKAEQRKRTKALVEDQALADEHGLSLVALHALYACTAQGSNGSPHATVKRVLEWRKKFDTKA